MIVAVAVPQLTITDLPLMVSDFDKQRPEDVYKRQIMLDLGTQLEIPAANNGGFTFFSMTTLSSTLPAQVEANQGSLNINGSVTFTGTKKGTFSGTNASFGGVSGSKKPIPFTGTYNCGGAIYPF